MIPVGFSQVFWLCLLEGGSVEPVIVLFFLMNVVEGILLFSVLSLYFMLGYVEVVAPIGHLHKPATPVASDLKKHGVNGGHGPRAELVWR